MLDHGETRRWRSGGPARCAGVRAASAAEPAEVRRAVTGLGVNLLVVEPAGKSISWMRQLATAFRRSRAPRGSRKLLQAGGRR